MATRMRDAMARHLAELRYEPTEKRIRAVLNGTTVADTTRAVLVWEPRRIVPSYAVPVEEFDAELIPAPSRPDDGPKILHPGISFTIHTTEGQPLSVRVGDETREEAAFRPADSDLADHVILDFRAFDQWYEEDDPMVAHPRDPYHRLDARPSSRHVRVELGGRLLAESRRPVLLFETGLPTRFYLPREDVRAELRPTEKVTYCAYKGRASYWSVGGEDDLAWTYREPLPDGARLAGLVAFFDERVDVTVDEVRREHPRTVFVRPHSPAP
jgi:uncharacterized protein (DUF427 family)